MKQLFAFAKELETAWKRKKNEHLHFPELATALMKQLPIHQLFRANDLAHWFAHHRNLPPQLGPGDFGDPPITIFSNRDFVVDILIWTKTNTSIHDHSFSGAFGVMTGQTLHSEYAFEVEREVVPDLRIGRLTPNGTELLSPGDVRPIVAGPSFIHRTCHIGIPTVSLVARTMVDAQVNTQFTYHPWRMATAFRPRLKSPKLIRLKKLLSFYEKTMPSRLDAFARDTLGALMPTEYFPFLKDYYNLIEDYERLRRVLKGLGRKHEDLAEILAESTRHEFNIGQAKIDRLENAEQKLLLSLLTAAPGRQEFLAFLKTHLTHETSVVDYVTSTLDALCKTDAVWFDFDRNGLELIRAHLETWTRDEAFGRLREISRGPRARRGTRDFERIRQMMLESTVLRTLVEQPGDAADPSLRLAA